MRVKRHHAGLDPASIIMSRCPGQLTAPMDSCFRRNGSGSVDSLLHHAAPGMSEWATHCSNGFLLSQEWEWIPASAGMGVGVCAGVVAATPVTMPGLTRHPLLCRVALGNSLLQWIPASAGMGVGMDSCFRRNGSGSVRRSGGRCPRHHAGLDPASIIMSRCPGQLTAPMDSCFRRNGSGNGFLLSQEW